MELKKLDKYGPHCFIEKDEIQEIYEVILEIHKEYLSKYRVVMPGLNSFQGLQLVFLYKYRDYLIHKDTISEFVRDIYPNAGKDQQVRHLAAKGWYLLNRNEVIPGTNGKKVPSGYHFLYEVTIPKPSFQIEILKRLGRVEAKTFEELIIIYDNRCATCGAERGKPHSKFNEKRVELQQGHMNPKEPLTLDNTIPQCQVCNTRYLNFFEFDQHGYIKSVYNPSFILRSEKTIKREIYRLLKDELSLDE